MMESPKALPSFTAHRLHSPPNIATVPTHLNVGLRLRLIQPTSTEHRGTADRHPYDGIVEGASVGYREPAASTAPTPQPPHPLERRITPSANPTYVAWTSRIGRSLFVSWNRQRRFRRLPRTDCIHRPNTATAPTHSNVGLRLRLIQPTLPGHRGAANRFP